MKLRKENGELLFDTDKIVYGLVKSDYLAVEEMWGRYYIKGNNVDPDQASSWTQQPDSTGEQMYTITVANARSPLCFLVGKGVLQGTSVSGSSVTFIYSAASTSTKAYVFDLMADNIAGRPYVKTRNQAGVITFNSLQPALNIATVIQAPPPPAMSPGNYYGSAYNGGRWDVISTGGTSGGLVVSHNIVDIALGAGDFAACLPWSRGATVVLTPSYTGTAPYQLGFAEGAYGYSGGISFIFSTAGATTMRNVTSLIASPQMTGLLVDRLPQALVINTAGLPFPFL